MTEQLHPSEPTLSERYSRATAAYYQKDSFPERRVPVPIDIEAAEQIAHAADRVLTEINRAGFHPDVEDIVMAQAVEDIESCHAQSIDAYYEFDEPAKQTEAYKKSHEPFAPSEAHDPAQFTFDAILKFKNDEEQKPYDDAFKRITKGL